MYKKFSLLPLLILVLGSITSCNVDLKDPNTTPPTSDPHVIKNTEISLNVGANSVAESLAITITKQDPTARSSSDTFELILDKVKGNTTSQVTLNGDFGTPTAIPNIEHDATYTIASLKETTGSTSRDIDTSSLPFTLIPHKEKIKFTPKAGTGPGTHTYKLQVMHIEYSLNGAKDGFENVLLYYMFNNNLITEYSTTRLAVIALRLSSSADVTWNYCSEATARSCIIYYKHTENTDSNFYDGGIVDDSRATIAFRNEVRSNTLALLASGIKSQETIGNLHTDCFSYIGLQEPRDKNRSDSHLAYSDRYVSIYGSYMRFKIGDVDYRPIDNTPGSSLLLGGIVYTSHVDINYEAATPPITSNDPENVNVIDTGFDPIADTRTRPRGGTLLLCESSTSGTTHAKYYLMKIPSTEVSNALIFETF